MGKRDPPALALRLILAQWANFDIFCREVAFMPSVASQGVGPDHHPGKFGRRNLDRTTGRAGGSQLVLAPMRFWDRAALQGIPRALHLNLGQER